MLRWRTSYGRHIKEVMFDVKIAEIVVMENYDIYLQMLEQPTDFSKSAVKLMTEVIHNSTMKLEREGYFDKNI